MKPLTLFLNYSNIQNRWHFTGIVWHDSFGHKSMDLLPSVGLDQLLKCNRSLGPFLRSRSTYVNKFTRMSKVNSTDPSAWIASVSCSVSRYRWQEWGVFDDNLPFRLVPVPTTEKRSRCIWCVFHGLGIKIHTSVMKGGGGGVGVGGGGAADWTAEGADWLPWLLCQSLSP